MRSPIAVEEQVARHAQAVLQETLAGARKLDVLAERIALHIESLAPRGRVSCLDVGGDAALREAIQDRAPRIDWRCIEARNIAAEARKHDGSTAPSDERQFDIALICDVLHRTDRRAELLEAAGRLARRVLIKDQFEQSGIPQRFLTREAFTRLATEREFVITALDCGLSLHDRVPLARTLLRSDSDFIAVLRRA